MTKPVAVWYRRAITANLTAINTELGCRPNTKTLAHPTKNSQPSKACAHGHRLDGRPVVKHSPPRSFEMQQRDGQEQRAARDHDRCKDDNEPLDRADLFAGFIRPFAPRGLVPRQHGTLAKHRCLHLNTTNRDIVRRRAATNRFSGVRDKPGLW